MRFYHFFTAYHLPHRPANPTPLVDLPSAGSLAGSRPTGRGSAPGRALPPLGGPLWCQRTKLGGARQADRVQKFYPRRIFSQDVRIEKRTVPSLQFDCSSEKPLHHIYHPCILIFATMKNNCKGARGVPRGPGRNSVVLLVLARGPLARWADARLRSLGR